MRAPRPRGLTIFIIPLLSPPGGSVLFPGASCRASTEDTCMPQLHNSWFHFTSMESKGMCFPGFCHVPSTPLPAQMLP